MASKTAASSFLWSQISRTSISTATAALPIRRVAITTTKRTFSLISSSSRLSCRSPTHISRSLLPLTYSPSFLQRRTLFIQTETTPNPDALKFNPGLPVLPTGAQSLEYVDGRDTYNSPLARRLFQLDGVTSVFYGPDFITVSKSPDSHWAYLKPEVFALITEFLNNGGSVVDLATMEGGLKMAEDTKPSEGDNEIVSMIKELLDTRIRPAIQEDGGDIEYRGFDEDTGNVMLKLRGACRTCDSSTVTLKNGIESMLMHYIEEVKGVIQVLDQEEEIAQREFERFEANLRKLKGEDATAGTGPHGIDSAPS